MSSSVRVDGHNVAISRCPAPIDAAHLPGIRRPGLHPGRGMGRPGPAPDPAEWLHLEFDSTSHRPFRQQQTRAAPGRRPGVIPRLVFFVPPPNIRRAGEACGPALLLRPAMPEREQTAADHITALVWRWHKAATAAYPADPDDPGRATILVRCDYRPAGHHTFVSPPPSARPGVGFSPLPPSIPGCATRPSAPTTAPGTRLSIPNVPALWRWRLGSRSHTPVDISAAPPGPPRDPAQNAPPRCATALHTPTPTD